MKDFVATSIITLTVFLTFLLSKAGLGADYTAAIAMALGFGCGLLVFGGSLDKLK